MINLILIVFQHQMQTILPVGIQCVFELELHLNHSIDLFHVGTVSTFDQICILIIVQLKTDRGNVVSIGIHTQIDGLALTYRC